MPRSLRTLSVFARPSSYLHPLTRSRHSLLRQNGDANIQHVRFTTPFPRRAKKLFYQLIIGYVVTNVALKYVLAEGEETKDEASAHSKTQGENRDKANDGAQQDEDDEDDIQVPEVMPEDAFFIPLGMAREIPHTYYKGSDPEWQSFIEFRQDRKRSAAIQVELVEHIYSYCTTHAQGQLGVGMPLKMGRVWLDIIIPSGPSPEYERPGLEIARDYIALTTRPVSALQVARINSALKPLPVAYSIWASGSTYCSLQLARLKQLFNSAPSSPETSPQVPIEIVTIDQLREKSPPKETQTRAQMDKMSDPKTDVASTKGSAKSTSSEGSRIYGAPPPLPLPHSDIGDVVKDFKRALAKNWQAPNTTGERGTFVVTGDVELIGPKGTCVFNVMADYHPREAKYRNVRLAFRYNIPRRQRPIAPPPSESKSSGEVR